MFWNDITEMRKEIKHLKRSIDELHCKMFQGPMYCKCKNQGVLTEEHEGEESRLEHLESLIESIKENIEDTLGDCNNSEIGQIQDQLNVLISDEKRLESVMIAGKVLDKFEDYMKNVDKLNNLVNEMKGMVSVTRACLQEKKEFDAVLQAVKELSITAKKHFEESQKYAEYAMGLHNQHFKIDALYRNLAEIQGSREEKKKRVRKPAS